MVRRPLTVPFTDSKFLPDFSQIAVIGSSEKGWMVTSSSVVDHIYVKLQQECIVHLGLWYQM